MCVIIYKPIEAALSKETLQEGMRCNSHGWGLMYAQDNVLWYEKGIGGFKQFYRRYNELELADKAVAIHFRIKTHGKINEHNCHPHEVLNGDGKALFVMHNGILAGYSDPQDKKSDTRLFAEELATTLSYNPDLLNDKLFTDMLHKKTEGSKLLFMDNAGNIKFLHEDKGNWTDGVWYSNLSCRITHYNNKPAALPPTSNYPYERDWPDDGDYSYGWQDGKVWDNKVQGWVWKDEVNKGPVGITVTTVSETTDETTIDEPQPDTSWTKQEVEEFKLIMKDKFELMLDCVENYTEARALLESHHDEEEREILLKLLDEEEAWDRENQKAITVLKEEYGVEDTGDLISDDPYLVNQVVQSQLKKDNKIVELRPSKEQVQEGVDLLRKTILKKQEAK